MEGEKVLEEVVDTVGDWEEEGVEEEEVEGERVMEGEVVGV